MANYCMKCNFEIWEGTPFALGKAATAKQGRKKKTQNKKQRTDVQQDKAPVLDWESNTHPAPHSP